LSKCAQSVVEVVTQVGRLGGNDKVASFLLVKLPEISQIERPRLLESQYCCEDYQQVEVSFSDSVCEFTATSMVAMP